MVTQHLENEVRCSVLLFILMEVSDSCLRFLLNYKHLPYETTWVRYENIERLSKELGVLPTRETTPKYTLPLISVHEPGAEPLAVVDSMRIAEYIERTYPDRAFATSALLAEQQEHVDAIRKNVAGQFCALIVPGAVKNFDEPSVSYYNSTRSGVFGMFRLVVLVIRRYLMQAISDVSELEAWADPSNHPQLWKQAKEGLDALATYISGLQHSEASLFTQAQEPAYADALLVGLFLWMEKTGPEGGWEKIRGWNDGVWDRAYKLLEPYMQVL